MQRKLRQTLKEYFDDGNLDDLGFSVNHIETSCAKDVEDEMVMLVSKLTEYRRSEFGARLKDNYFFIIEQAFEDLERIYEEVRANVESLKNSNDYKNLEESKEENSGKNDGENIIPYLLKCIEILEPPYIDRLLMIPHMKDI